MIRSLVFAATLTIGGALTSAFGEDASTEAAQSAVPFAELVDAKQWDEAEAHARARLEASPDDVEAKADLAHVLLLSKQRDRYDEAIQLLEAATEVQPNHAHHYFLLGQLYGARARAAGMGGLSLARRSKGALSRAVELEPENFEYVYALNEYLIEAPFIAGGSAGRARKIAEEFSRKDPDGGAMLSARILIVDRQYDKALEILRKLERRDIVLYDATRRMLLIQAGMGLLETGRAGEALPVFVDVAAEFPNNADAHLGLGRARFETGDVAGALEALERSLEISRRLETLYRLAIAKQAAGEHEEARALFSEAEQAARGEMADDIQRRLAKLEG